LEDVKGSYHGVFEVLYQHHPRAADLIC